MLHQPGRQSARFTSFTSAGLWDKTTNHSRHSTPPAPQRTWTGEGMNPRVWAGGRRPSASWPSRPQRTWIRRWGGGRHVTQQMHLPKMCGAIFHFSLDSETATPQPAIITSETKAAETQCCVQVHTAILIKKSSPVFYHHSSDFPSWSSFWLLWLQNGDGDVEECMSPGAPSTDDLTPDRKESRNWQTAAIYVSQTSGAFSFTFLASFQRKSPAPPLFLRLPFLPSLSQQLTVFININCR